MKVMVIPFIGCVFGTVSKGLEKRLEELEIKGRIETIQTKALLRFGGNTQKSLRDLRRFGVTQTPVKDHHLKLV